MNERACPYCRGTGKVGPQRTVCEVCSRHFTDEQLSTAWTRRYCSSECWEFKSHDLVAEYRRVREAAVGFDVGIRPAPHRLRRPIYVKCLRCDTWRMVDIRELASAVEEHRCG